MKFISPKLHSYLDYLLSAVLILFHWIFGYELRGADSWIPLITGITILTYSVLTRFRDEHFGIIPLKTHLLFDVIMGIILVTGPWLSHFAKRLPYLQTILGVVVIALAGMTKVEPYQKIRPTDEE